MYLFLSISVLLYWYLHIFCKHLLVVFFTGKTNISSQKSLLGFITHAIVDPMEVLVLNTSELQVLLYTPSLKDNLRSCRFTPSI